MKLSARNILKGKIVDVVKGQTTAHVRIDIGGAVVTASITNEAVDELGSKKECNQIIGRYDRGRLNRARTSSD